MLLRCSLELLTDKTTATKSVNDLADGAVNSAIARDNGPTTAEGSVTESLAHAYVDVFNQVQLFHPSDSVLTVVTGRSPQVRRLCLCLWAWKTYRSTARSAKCRCHQPGFYVIQSACCPTRSFCPQSKTETKQWLVGRQAQ